MAFHHRKKLWQLAQIWSSRGIRWRWSRTSSGLFSLIFWMQNLACHLLFSLLSQEKAKDVLVRRGSDKGNMPQENFSIDAGNITLTSIRIRLWNGNYILAGRCRRWRIHVQHVRARMTAWMGTFLPHTTLQLFLDQIRCRSRSCWLGHSIHKVQSSQSDDDGMRRFWSPRITFVNHSFTIPRGKCASAARDNAFLINSLIPFMKTRALWQSCLMNIIDSEI